MVSPSHRVFFPLVLRKPVNVCNYSVSSDSDFQILETSCIGSTMTCCCVCDRSWASVLHSSGVSGVSWPAVWLYLTLFFMLLCICLLSCQCCHMPAAFLTFLSGCSGRRNAARRQHPENCPAAAAARQADCSFGSNHEKKIHLWKKCDGWWEAAACDVERVFDFGSERRHSLTALQGEGGKSAHRQKTRRACGGKTLSGNKWDKNDWFLNEVWWWKHLSDAWIIVCKCCVGVRLWESRLQSLCGPSLVSEETD